METTAGRIFKLTVTSARDLELVRTPLPKMKVYAICTISGDTKSEKKTPVDKNGQLNPLWNHRMEYELPKDVLEDPGAMLVIKLFCKRNVFKGGDVYIGEVNKSIKDVFNSAQGNSGSLELDLPLQKGSVGTNGMVKFSVTFGEERSIVRRSFLSKQVAKVSKTVGQVIGEVGIGAELYTIF